MRSFKYLLALLIVDIGALASPVSDADLTDMVKRGELKPEEEVSELEKRQCAACGVYLCAGPDFTGQCYWGCYPPRTLIEIDPYWQLRIASVGPDRGCYCTIGTPQRSSCQGFEHPGGNVGNNNCRGNVGNFYCVPN
ncbi:hypothetical protein ACJ41O_006221 [Fusarium nematophilum]